MRALADLWAGRLPLAAAFWTHGVVIALALNVVATGAGLASASAGLPAWAVLALHLSPAPYNLATVLGVWRSAARHPGDRIWPDLARVAIILWAAALTVA